MWPELQGCPTRRRGSTPSSRCQRLQHLTLSPDQCASGQPGKINGLRIEMFGIMFSFDKYIFIIKLFAKLYKKSAKEQFYIEKIKYKCDIALFSPDNHRRSNFRISCHSSGK